MTSLGPREPGSAILKLQTIPEVATYSAGPTFSFWFQEPEDFPKAPNLLGKPLEDYVRANRRTFRLLRESMVDAWLQTTFGASSILSINESYGDAGERILFEDSGDGHRVHQQAEGVGTHFLAATRSLLENEISWARIFQSRDGYKHMIFARALEPWVCCSPSMGWSQQFNAS